jgi:hypothetical protein
MPMNPGTSQTGQGDGGAGPARLRIGVHRLPAPDIMMVRAFIQMSTTFTENFPWVFAEEPPFDLLLVDADSRHRPPEGTGEMLLITDHGAHSPDMMQRPLRFRVLEDWLMQKAPEMHAERRHRPEPPAAAGLPGGADFYIRKLERWPPSGFLQHDRLRLRVATILTANGMHLSDLVRLCRQPEAEILDCARAFRDAGLLKFEPAARRTDAQSPASGRPVPDAEPARKSKPGSGLIASIRRRLGL